MRVVSECTQSSRGARSVVAGKLVPHPSAVMLQRPEWRGSDAHHLLVLDKISHVFGGKLPRSLDFRILNQEDF